MALGSNRNAFNREKISRGDRFFFSLRFHRQTITDFKSFSSLLRVVSLEPRGSSGFRYTENYRHDLDSNRYSLPDIHCRARSSRVKARRREPAHYVRFATHLCR